MKNIGEKLRQIRISNKRSLRKVADLSGISHTEISRIEKGLRDAPSPEILKKLALGLGVQYEWLLVQFGYIDNKKKQGRGDFNYLLTDISKIAGSGIDISKIDQYDISYNGIELTDKEKLAIKDFVDLIMNNKGDQ